MLATIRVSCQDIVRSIGPHCALFLAFLLLPIASVGQEQSNTNETKHPTPLTLTDPYQIIDQARRLSEEAQTLESKDDEIKLLAGLSDSVWTLDESLGRRLLIRSFDLVLKSLQENNNSNPDPSSPTLLFRQISTIASKRDLKLNSQFEQDWQTGLANAHRGVEESKTDTAQLSYSLLRQAGAELPKDPQRARLLFRQSVSIRVLPSHCFFLMSQRKHVADSTDAFFSDALAALSQRSLSEANEILVLSSYLFSPDESINYLAISGYNAANTAGNTSAAPKNPALAAAYLALLVNKLNPSEAIPPAVVYFALKNVVPQYQTFAPQLLNDVYAKIGTLGPSVSKDDSSSFESANKDFGASSAEVTAEWEKRIQKADQIDAEGRRDLEYYTILLGYLLPKKDFTRAETIINHISNQDLKNKLGDLFKLTSLQTQIEKTSSSLYESDCDKIKNPLLRVIALSNLAAVKLKQKANPDALQLLNHATTEAKRIEGDQDRLQAQLMIALLSLGADTTLGFDSAITAFKDINKFPDFDIRRAGLSLNVTVYGLTNQLPLTTPLPSSLTSTVGRMSHVNPVATFQICAVLAEKKTRLWTTYEAVRIALLDATAKSTSQKAVLR
jgi:hypothetical protein